MAMSWAVSSSSMMNSTVARSKVRYEASAVLFSPTAASVKVHDWTAMVGLPNCWLLMELLTVRGLGLVDEPSADLFERRDLSGGCGNAGVVGLVNPAGSGRRRGRRRRAGRYSWRSAASDQVYEVTSWACLLADRYSLLEAEMPEARWREGKRLDVDEADSKHCKVFWCDGAQALIGSWPNLFFQISGEIAFAEDLANR